VTEAVTWTERNRGRYEERKRRKNEGKRKKRGRKERRTRVRPEGERRKRMKTG
jgi:hypothetical protein